MRKKGPRKCHEENDDRNHGSVWRDQHTATSSPVDEVYVAAGAMMLIRIPWRAQSLHSHRPLELVASLDGPIEMQAGAGKTIRSDSFLVPPMQPHALSRYDGRVARLYLDAGYRSVGAWKARPIMTDFADKGEIIRSLAQFFDGSAKADVAHDIMRLWLETWATPTDMREPSDPRVATVLRYLDSQGASPAADRQSMARLVGLSPSRFGAIFAADTGASLSRYLIWHRVRMAISLICGKGESVTAAALATGFSDGAHLARSCRATYGCPPSHLKRRQRKTQQKLP